MDKKIRISIPVGEGRYPMHIDPKDEPLFREAGRIINRRLNAYRTRFRTADLTAEDILAMTAIDLVVEAQRQGHATGLQAAEAETAGLIADLQQFLDPEAE